MLHRLPERDGFAVLDTYRGLGGNLLDTAKGYGEGAAERLVGRWLAARGARGDMMLMDKGCLDEGSLTRAGIAEGIGGGLERLDTDHLDLFVVHRDHPEVPPGPVVEAMNEEIAAGRIAGFGVSNWPVERVEAALDYAAGRGLHGPAISSVHVSLAVPAVPLWPNCLHATEADLSWHRRTGMPLLAWSPLAHGFLTDHRGPAEDSDERIARSYHNEANLERRRRGEQLAEEKGVTLAQVALAYVLGLPAPIIAIVGALMPEEVESCVASTEVEVSPREVRWLSLKCESR